MNKGLAFFLCSLILLLSCGPDKNRETHTQGKLKIAADPAVAKLSRELTDAFSFIYKYSDIEIRSMRESDAINALLDDSVRMIIIPGTLSQEQVKALESKRVFPRMTVIALDAVALIIHPENPDSLMNLDQVKDILSGKIKTWKNISSANSSGEISLIFDEAGSSVVNYMKDSLMDGADIGAKVFAAGDNPSVIEYVAENKGAIGCIGVNWICSANDSMAIGFLQKVRPVHLQNGEDKSYYLPFQAWIGMGKYPLRRKIYALTLESKAGLGEGFVAFAAGDKGQRIVLKSGLMPATKPTRQVELR